jgi:hypothetical protein
MWWTSQRAAGAPQPPTQVRSRAMTARRSARLGVRVVRPTPTGCPSAKAMEVTSASQQTSRAVSSDTGP